VKDVADGVHCKIFKTKSFTKAKERALMAADV
jgi:hypothetical protein